MYLLSHENIKDCQRGHDEIHPSARWTERVVNFNSCWFTTALMGGPVLNFQWFRKQSTCFCNYGDIHTHVHHTSNTLSIKSDLGSIEKRALSKRFLNYESLLLIIGLRNTLPED